ncbi:MAG: leucyl aminopeptidase [Acidimicrobiia bacterium]
MPITVTTVRSAPPDATATATGCASGPGRDEALAALGVDPAFAAGQGFEAGAGEVRAVPGEGGTTRYLVGLGPVGQLDAQVLRRAAGNLARAASRHPRLVVDLLADLPEGLDRNVALGAVVEGALLGAYRYVALRSDPKPHALAELVVVGPTGKRAEAAVERAQVVAEAVNQARDLVNEPGGSLTPSRLAEVARAMGAAAGFGVEVWDLERIRAERLGGLLGVNRGSAQEPRLLVLRHEPPSARATLALVGKGITFDSGGLSLKQPDSMIGMKGDMGGGAAVLGAFSAAARLGLRTRLIGFVPITDNMTGPDATRVGDVLTIRNGKTVEVLNTDAEGRLILSDGLSLATEAGPDAIVDLATLTGACMVALGGRIAGLMGNDDDFAAQVGAAAGAAGEPVWRLPLPTDLRSKLDSDVADLKNVGDRYGGALTAGLFLQEFVGEGVPWVHLDIAGPADSKEADGELPKGGTGFGVRTLVELAAGFRKPRRAKG